MGEDRYDMDTMEARPGPKRNYSSGKTSARAGKVFLVYSLPRLLGILAIVWVLLLLHATWPEYGVSRGYVNSSRGTVMMLVPAGQAPKPADTWTECWKDRDILAKDRLQTLNGTLDLRFYEGSYVTLAPNTQASIIDIHFDRRTGSIYRALALQRGTLFLRTGRPIGHSARFAVQSGGGSVSGFDSVFMVDAGKAAVLSGQVTLERAGQSWPCPAGQAINLASGATRTLTSLEQKELAAASQALPTVSWDDQAKLLVVGFELGVILQKTGGLLKLLGHKTGDGGFVAALPLVDQGKRKRLANRLKPVFDSLVSVSDPPASFRLDSFSTLGLNAEQRELLRPALFRGQFMGYAAGSDGKDFRLVGIAQDRQHTPVMCTRTGVTIQGAKKK